MIIESINPATGEVIKTYQKMSSDEIKDILNKSESAYKQWKQKDMDERKHLFRELAKVLRQNKEDYAQLMTAEMGKPIKQARAEAEKCAWACEVYADNVEKWIEEEVVIADGLKHRVLYQPLGVILSIMPWNFPFWQAFRFAIPSIIMGNTTILKHSNDVPGCALAIEDSFKQAGFPEDVFRTVLASHDDVDYLISSSTIQGVSLTGSTTAGSLIAEKAGKNLKKVVLELGGSDPFIVLEDVDLDYVVKNAVYGRVQNNGQSCIAAKRFIVRQEIADDFANKFADAIGKLKIGDPTNEDVDIGPMANKGEYTTILEQFDDAKTKGAHFLNEGGKLGEKGYYFKPCVAKNVTNDMKIVNQEVFGPIAPIIEVKTDEEALSIANNSEFGLGGSVWTSDLDRGEAIARKIEAGSVFVNSIVKSDPRMPFGGVKQSGIGRELSKFGLKEFVNIKGLNVYNHQ